jgi:hypothetical protein
MHKELRPEQIDILVGSSAVNNEFSNKVRELDRRLQMNGMQYREWDTLNDRQHDIFTDNLFLDGECAASVDHYVKGAVKACGCPDTEEELHHHSPVLMGEIEKQEDMLPDMTVKIGESLGNLNEAIDLFLENLILEAEPLENPSEIPDVIQDKGNTSSAQSILFPKEVWKKEKTSSPSEAVEVYIAYAAERHSAYQNLSWEKVRISGAYKENQDLARRALALGTKIGIAGGITAARKYDNPLDTEVRGDAASAAGLMNTPKTDLLFQSSKFGEMRVSLKDAKEGSQIEAIEANSFPIIFNAAVEQFLEKTDNPVWATLWGGTFDEMADILQKVLDDYRSGKDGGSVVNNYLRLKGGDPESADELKAFAFGSLTGSYIEQLQSLMLELFEDPLFRFYFIRQAMTGEYKFKEGTPAIANWLMKINLPNQTFGARKINDKLMKEQVEYVTFNVRTGRAKAALQADAAAEKTKAGKKWKYVVNLLSDLQKPLGLSNNDDVAKWLEANYPTSTSNKFWIYDKADITGINKFVYTFLKDTAKKLSAQLEDNPTAAPEDIFDNLWKRFISRTKVSGSELGDDVMFAGRSGRFGLDSPKEKGPLPDTYEEALVTNDDVITEGMLQDAWDLISKPIKGLANIARKGIDQFLAAIGVSATAAIPEAPVSLDDKFEQ